MIRGLIATTLLVGCSQSLEERLDELDARASVDCGTVSDCDSRVHAEEVTSCMRTNLAAGVPARAVFILDIDPVAYVYALDGSYVYIAGYYDEDDADFTESRCMDVTVGSGPMCVSAYGTDCIEVRDW